MSWMSSPLGQGASSWARTTHFADLAWGMTRKKVLALFPGARSYRTTGHANPSVGLAPKQTPVPELGVEAMATFDANDCLDSLTVDSAVPRPDNATDAVVLAAANRVAEALGIDALAALPSAPLTWTVRGTKITLERDPDGFRFELTPER